MQRFEYRVVPAPKKGEKGPGAKTTPDRFAFALTSLMNKLGAEGWDYVRADTLPCDERVGFTGSKTSFQNMLVFRRVIERAKPQPEAVLTIAPPRLSSPEILKEPLDQTLPPPPSVQSEPAVSKKLAAE